LPEKYKESLIEAIISQDQILTYREINKLLSFPELIREESSETKDNL